jgi:DNA polymerase delta subunit 1
VLILQHFSTMTTTRKHNPPSPLFSTPKRLRGGYDEDFDFHPNEDDDDYLDDQPLPPDEMDPSPSSQLTTINIDASKYTRPPVTHTTNNSDLNLQWLDIDTIISNTPLTSNPSGKPTLGSTVGSVPVIRIYGVNETGNSVAVFIHGFTPYAHFALPRGCTLDNSDENLGSIRNSVEESLKAKLGNMQGKDTQCCLGVQYVTDKSSIMGYDPSHTTFLKVYVSLPSMITKLKSIMEEGMVLPGMMDGAGNPVGDVVMLAPYECNVPFVMRYMIDFDITGASWLTLPMGSYGLRVEEGERGTHCQVSWLCFVHVVLFDLVF